MTNTITNESTIKSIISIKKKSNLLFATIGLLCIFLQSCGTAEKASVYKPGRVWEFDVTVQDSSEIEFIWDL